MSVSIFILDYQRFSNISDFILPHLLNEPCVNQIIISHGSYDYEKAKHPFFPPLAPDEIQQFDLSGRQIIRIQDTLNRTYQCFRRWINLESLIEKGYIKNSLILTHDDDFYFKEGQIQRMLDVKEKGLCICGSGGRSCTPYQVAAINGPCSIAVGQSMLISREHVLYVCKEVKRLRINHVILHEDDIVVSIVLGKGEPVHYGIRLDKHYLPSPKSRWLRPHHIPLRTRTALMVLTYVKDASSMPSSLPHLHSPDTTLGTLETSQSIELPPSSP